MAAGPRKGLVLCNLVLANIFFSGMASVASTSRVVFAMARDNALPFSKTLSTVSDHTGSPIAAVRLLALSQPNDCAGHQLNT